MPHNNRQIDVAGAGHVTTYRAAEEIRGGNHSGVTLDFRCDESSEFSKKLPLPFKKWLQLLDERMLAVKLESVRPWGSASHDHALISE